MLKGLLFLLALPLLAQVPAVNSGTAVYPTSGTICTTATCTTGGPYLPLAGGTLTGNLLFTDASFDIGASGATRPRNIFLSGTATFGTPLSVANGGWGLATLTAHALYAGNATTAPNAVGPDASTTKALFSAGSSADPAFRAIASADLPATVVRTDQTNTYSTGAQDMGSATSLKLPTSAGAAPSASGQCAMDSTRGTQKCYDDLLATSTPRVTAPSTQLGASDTLACSTINTNPTLFATTYTIPANTLIANKAFRVSTGFVAVGTGASTWILKLKLGTVAIFASTSATDPNATAVGGMTMLIQGTAAAGGSVNVETEKIGGGNFVPLNNSDTLTQPVAIATNAQQVLAWELTCNNNTAAQNLQLRQLVVESIN